MDINWSERIGDFSILTIGVLLSAALVVMGLILVSITGDTSYPFGIVDLNWILWGDPFLGPSHMMFLGFFVLILTPVINVSISLLSFIKKRERYLVLITSLVLLILAFSMMLGIG